MQLCRQLTVYTPFPPFKGEISACITFQDSSKSIAVHFHEGRKTNTNLQDLPHIYMQRFQKTASLIIHQGLFSIQKTTITEHNHKMIVLRYDSSRNLFYIIFCDQMWAEDVFPRTESRKRKGFFIFGFTCCTKAVSTQSETLLVITIPVSFFRLKFLSPEFMQALTVYYYLSICSSSICSLLSYFQIFHLSVSLNTSTICLLVLLLPVQIIPSSVVFQ